MTISERWAFRPSMSPPREVGDSPKPGPGGPRQEDQRVGVSRARVELRISLLPRDRDGTPRCARGPSLVASVQAPGCVEHEADLPVGNGPIPAVLLVEKRGMALWLRYP